MIDTEIIYNLEPQPTAYWWRNIYGQPFGRQDLRGGQLGWFTLDLYCI